MEEEIKSAATGEERQVETPAPSAPSEAVAPTAAASAPVPAGDVNAAVPTLAPAAGANAAAPAPAPVPAATAPVATAPASFCRNCGQALAAGDAFCPKCGTPRGVAGATPQPVVAPVNTVAPQPVKAKKKKTLAIIVAVLALVAIVVGVIAVNAKPKGPDLQALYDEYCSSPWAKVASDGSYLAIDTNPSDTESGKYTYLLDANQAIEDINKALGFKESLLEEMNHTNSLMGVRTETDNGVKVTWRYHPDNGLEVTYSLYDE